MQPPKMEKFEIDFFDWFFNLKIEMDVFEWGSGWSTVRWGEKVNSWYAVEHAQKWVDLVKEKCSIKTIYKFEDKIDYVNLPWTLDKNFNVFFVDGRYRFECIQSIDEKAKNDYIIFLHDKDEYPLYEGFYRVDLFEGGTDLKQGGIRMYFKDKNHLVQKVLDKVFN